MARRLILKGIFPVILILGITFANADKGDNRLTPAEKAAGWRLLFDGKSLKGWKATGDPKGWAVQDAAIVNLVKGGGYLATEETFGNFQLALDYKIEKGVNSGIFFRWANLSDPVQTGIEMQILDSYGNKEPSRHDNGAIYDVLAPKKEASKPAGEWNHVVLTCKDNLIMVDMNGERIITMNLDRWTEAHKNPDGSANKFDTPYKDMPRSGHIGIQDHGGKIWVKNIKIRPL